MKSKRERPVQYFTSEYLERCAEMTPDQTIEFIENYRTLLADAAEKCQLISIKIEPSLLAAFKRKAALKGVPYQTHMKKLMRDWILDNE